MQKTADPDGVCCFLHQSADNLGLIPFCLPPAGEGAALAADEGEARRPPKPILYVIARRAKQPMAGGNPSSLPEKDQKPSRGNGLPRRRKRLLAMTKLSAHSVHRFLHMMQGKILRLRCAPLRMTCEGIGTQRARRSAPLRGTGNAAQLIDNGRGGAPPQTVKKL